jgi:arylsulfatase A-like enzyme
MKMSFLFNRPSIGPLRKAVLGQLLATMVSASAGVAGSTTAGVAPPPPNIILILADDLGYGDLSCYGHPSIHTPQLDRMAAEGLRFTDFYAPSELCTPSRAAILTGRYAIRSGMSHGARRVLFPDSQGGLPGKEVTIARALKARGYATAHIGKWHLGVHPGSRPQDHGFDFTFGLPYSNDMDTRPGLPKTTAASPTPPADGWNVPLQRNGTVIERPADQTTLTKRYTGEAVRFIAEHAKGPFFLYFAHTFPHIPMFASPDFKGRSLRGIYGDAVEEMDASVGQVLAELRRRGLAENTWVFFTSDNGPWLTGNPQGGSAGLLREGKGSTWEGGLRVPGIAWWLGRIRPGITHEAANGMDLFTTALGLAGAEIPGDRPIDGVDLRPLLLQNRSLPSRPFFYYQGDTLCACRLGLWKAHFVTRTGVDGRTAPALHEPPLLYHLGRDPSEQFNVATENPAVLAEIRLAVSNHLVTLVPGKRQLD